MFKNPTVVVVGAGASAEFGFPTGIGLYNEALHDAASASIPGARSGYEARYLSTFTDFLNAVNDSKSLEEFRELQSHLGKSSATSIDLYAYNNPSRAFLAKRFTAWRLVKHHFELELTINRNSESVYRLVPRQPWRSRTVGEHDSSRQNWIGALTTKFTSGARSVEDLRSNKLTLVPAVHES